MARCARSPELRGDSDRLGVARVRTRATTPGLSPPCWFRARAIDGQRSVARLSVCWWLAACDIHMLPLTSKIKGGTRTPIFYHSLKLEITFCVQGVLSPCLSNVFLHHVLDEWFETEVKPRLRGACTLVRFADDALMAFDNIDDAKRVLSVLGKRLARYGVTLHPDKTRLVDFRPKRLQSTRHPETDGTSFDFLGLTHVWGRSRNGKDMVRQVTAK